MRRERCAPLLFPRHGRTQRHPRPATFDGVLETGRGFAGSPQKVLSALEEQIRLTEANYFVGQFAFGDLSLEETLVSIGLFHSEVQPMLARIGEASEPVVS